MSGIWEHPIVIVHDVNFLNRDTAPDYIPVYAIDFDFEASNFLEPQLIAEHCFRVFNGIAYSNIENHHMFRYYEAGNRSLSVGDVVVIEGKAYKCESFGWNEIPIQEVMQYART